VRRAYSPDLRGGQRLDESIDPVAQRADVSLHFRNVAADVRHVGLKTSDSRFHSVRLLGCNCH